MDFIDDNSLQIAKYMHDNAGRYDLYEKKDDLYLLGLLHDVKDRRHKEEVPHIRRMLLEEMGLRRSYTQIAECHEMTPKAAARYLMVSEDELPAELLLLWEAKDRLEKIAV